MADILEMEIQNPSDTTLEIPSAGAPRSGGGGDAAWGSIGGTLSDQIDLKNALDAKANDNDLATVAKTGSYNDLSDKPVIPSLSGYATEAWVEAKGYLTQHQSLTDYATKEWVEGKGYLTSHQSLDGYATQSWVNNQGYLTQHQSLTGYATENWVNNQGFLKEHQSLSGYATRSWVTERGYLTATALTDYVKTSDLSTAINGVKTWVQNQNYLTAHQSLANYYTKTEIDAKGYLTEHQSLSGYATQAWVGQQGYLTLETAPPIKTVNGQSLIGTGNVEISGVDEVYVGAVEPDPSEGYKLWVDTSSEDTGIAQLWQNEDAISGAYTFAAQTISLNLSAFKAVYVDFLVKAGYSSHVCQMCIKGLTDRIFVGAYSAEVKFYDRIVKPTNSGVEFLDAASNGDTDNTVCVPYRIYGVR